MTQVNSKPTACAQYATALTNLSVKILLEVAVFLRQFRRSLEIAKKKKK